MFLNLQDQKMEQIFLHLLQVNIMWRKDIHTLIYLYTKLVQGQKGQKGPERTERTEGTERTERTQGTKRR